MSAYFESLNRGPTATAASARPAEPARRPVLFGRLTPGAVPSEYAALRERLLAASAPPARSIVFAGCDGSEGCTQVVREFAEALASMGLRTLLVDADMRTGGLTTKLAPRGGDLSKLAAGGGDPEDAPWGEGSLTIVPSPVGLVDKENFLRSPSLAAWLDRQQQRYDYVLLDVPPLERFADALLVSTLCDGVVLVVQPGHTNLQAVVRARERAARAGARLLGMVLNRAVDPMPPFLRRLLRSG
jgi:protein-tyrosine kinase